MSTHGLTPKGICRECSRAWHGWILKSDPESRRCECGGRISPKQSESEKEGVCLRRESADAAEW